MFSMNYYEFLDYCKNNTIFQRLENKPYDDKRRYQKRIYTETHHILPVSLGGGNTKENLIELLPEEHVFIHWLRYKEFNTYTDFLAVRGCFNKAFLKEIIQNKSKNFEDVLRLYAYYKDEIQNFRKTHGWHTEKGKKSISNARKNKMPVIDKESGDKIGSVDKNHPNILNGKWVHQTKGYTTAIELASGNKVRIKSGLIDNIKYKSIYTNKGNKNGNFNKDSFNTKDEFLCEAKAFFKRINCIISLQLIMKLKALKVDVPFIKKFVNSNFRLQMFGVSNFRELFSEVAGELPRYDTKSGIPKDIKEKYKVSSTLDYVLLKIQGETN